MFDNCAACPHNRNERIVQLDAELHPELYKEKPQASSVACETILKNAIGERACVIMTKNALSGMGRPYQDDLSQADRELAPILGAVTAQFLAQNKPSTGEPDPYAPTKPTLIPVPEKSKPQVAAVMLTGSPEQTKQAVAWLQGKLNAKAFYCEKLHQCKWQGFRLHQGLGWGEIPGERDPWRVWHTKECGGRLVELFTRVELEEVRADAT